MACPFKPEIGFCEEEEGSLTYSKYLQLDHLLSCTHPISDVHDEHLFIIVHQVYELWFKQLILELDSIRNIFMQKKVDERSMLIVNSRLTRVIKILSILVAQIKVLETMTPMDFSDFRHHLKTSSGFQSYQFRIFENKIGVKKKNRINYNNRNYSDIFMGEQRSRIQESEDEPSIFDLIQAWLERTPGLQISSFDFFESFKTHCYMWLNDEKRLAEEAETQHKKETLMKDYLNKKENFEQILIKENYETLLSRGDRNLTWKALHGALMIYYYRDEVVFHQPFQMLTLLMDIDSLVMEWRSNHTSLVQRQIGSKVGSGGSSGYRYLRSTFSDRYKAFLDLFQLSNYLIPREYIPKLDIATRKRLANVCMPDLSNKDVIIAGN